MLNLYAYSFVALLHSLRVAETSLETDIAADPQTRWPHTILETPLTLAYRVADSLAQQLDLESTKREVNRIAMLCNYNGLKSDILARLRELGVRIEEDLRTKHFFYVPDVFAAYWGKDAPFGEPVRQKFQKATTDIRSAGNCLALNEPTSCVFHLMRAMEVAVRKLGKRLGVPITPSTTWRQITGNMDAKIRAMPNATDAQRRKRNAWEEARANLHHVGSVWRNNTMHPAKSYTQSQARDVFEASRVFMTALAAL